MADVHDKATRSYNMSRIKAKNTKPEMMVRKFLHAHGFRYRLHILPHMSEIGKEDYENSGGSLGWFQQQGFYVYREDRLIVSSDWLGLEKKRDYSKLARIAVNFSNAYDFNWNLDIKKSTATPPIEIRKELLRIAKIAITKSAKIYNWRGQKTFSENSNLKYEPLWKDEITREGIKKYRINRKHPIIKSLLTEENRLAAKALKLLEDNVPIELILSNQNEDPSFHELEKQIESPSDELLKLLLKLKSGLFTVHALRLIWSIITLRKLIMTDILMAYMLLLLEEADCLAELH
jgi:hypothetical protein